MASTLRPLLISFAKELFAFLHFSSGKKSTMYTISVPLICTLICIAENFGMIIGVQKAVKY